MSRAFITPAVASLLAAVVSLTGCSAGNNPVPVVSNPLARANSSVVLSATDLNKLFGVNDYRPAIIGPDSVAVPFIGEVFLYVSETSAVRSVTINTIATSAYSAAIWSQYRNKLFDSRSMAVNEPTLGRDVFFDSNSINFLHKGSDGQGGSIVTITFGNSLGLTDELRQKLLAAAKLVVTNLNQN